MQKTILIGEKEVTLDNNIGWTFCYRSQFGRDIIPALMPMANAIVDVLAGLIEERGNAEEIELTDLVKVADSGRLTEAGFHLAGLEFIEIINIVWALAKNADSSIPEPEKWVKEFDTFPLDEVVPEVVSIITQGIVSTKNLERLRTNLPKPKTEKKSTSTKSSSRA